MYVIIQVNVLETERKRFTPQIIWIIEFTALLVHELYLMIVLDLQTYLVLISVELALYVNINTTKLNRSGSNESITTD